MTINSELRSDITKCMFKSITAEVWRAKKVDTGARWAGQT